MQVQFLVVILISLQEQEAARTGFQTFLGALRRRQDNIHSGTTWLSCAIQTTFVEQLKLVDWQVEKSN